MDAASLRVEREDAVLVITLDRPRVLNALNRDTLRQLDAAIADAAADASVRVVIITGAGERAFAAGADIGELAAQSPIEARAHAAFGQHVFDRLERIGKPVIAAVRGFALGGGCELAMACTIRVAADTATFGQPEINLGLIPGFGGSQRLPRLVGRGRALDLLLTGRSIGADEALRIGLVTRVVPAASLMTEVRALATELARKAPVAAQHIIDAVQVGADLPIDTGLAHEAALFGLVAATDDRREGTSAFLEKRQPAFKGR